MVTYPYDMPTDLADPARLKYVGLLDTCGPDDLNLHALEGVDGVDGDVVLEYWMPAGQAGVLSRVPGDLCWQVAWTAGTTVRLAAGSSHAAWLPLACGERTYLDLAADYVIHPGPLTGEWLLSRRLP